jgi:hypothetical protein
MEALTSFLKAVLQSSSSSTTSTDTADKDDSQQGRQDEGLLLWQPEIPLSKEPSESWQVRFPPPPSPLLSLSLPLLSSILFSPLRVMRVCALTWNKSQRKQKKTCLMMMMPGRVAPNQK